MFSTPGWAFIMPTGLPFVGSICTRWRTLVAATSTGCLVGGIAVGRCLPAFVHSRRFEPCSTPTREGAMRALAGWVVRVFSCSRPLRLGSMAWLMRLCERLCIRTPEGQRIGRALRPWQVCTTRSLPCSHAGHWLASICATRAMKSCAFSWATGLGIGMCEAALAKTSFASLALASSPWWRMRLSPLGKTCCTKRPMNVGPGRRNVRLLPCSPKNCWGTQTRPPP